MARYTELFAEWLEEGGEMPAQFATITIDGQTLGDLFTAHFAEREIGFETPTLFKLKFEGKAGVLCGELSKTLSAYNNALEALKNPKNTHTRTGSIQREYGDKQRNQWVEPNVGSNNYLTDTTAQAIDVEKASTDTESYQNITDTDIIGGAGDMINVVNFLTDPERKNYLEQWFNQFDSLFMQIY